MVVTYVQCEKVSIQIINFSNSLDYFLLFQVEKIVDILILSSMKVFVSESLTVGVQKCYS